MKYRLVEVGFIHAYSITERKGIVKRKLGFFCQRLVFVYAERKKDAVPEEGGNDLFHAYIIA